MPHFPIKGERPPWRATVLTLFPEMFPGPLGISLVGQALEAGLWSLRTVPIREFGLGRHRAVDDTPAGGGAGMVMRADVLASAIDHARVEEAEAPLIYLSPRGEPLTQTLASEIAAGPGALLLAGRFEGVDERVIAARRMREISIGDYVLSGGEPAAMVVADSIVRLLPGALGSDTSAVFDSFSEGILDYPHYTRPPEFEGMKVPDVLLSGNHAEIERWRREAALKKTRRNRPDLLKDS